MRVFVSENYEKRRGKEYETKKVPKGRAIVSMMNLLRGNVRYLN